MTIVSVRFYFMSKHPAQRLKLARSLGGFDEWFERRLKPIREQLRGPEAKGVNIVNFMLHENPAHAWQPDRWAQRMNSFQYSEVHDLSPLLLGVPIENIRKLMPWAAAECADAPWPQVRALVAPLSAPLTPADEETLSAFLRWPRSVGRFANM